MRYLGNSKKHIYIFLKFKHFGSTSAFLNLNFIRLLQGQIYLLELQAARQCCKMLHGDQ